MYTFVKDVDYLHIDNQQLLNVIYLSEYDDLDLHIIHNLKVNHHANWYILKYDQIFQLQNDITLNNYYEFTNAFIQLIQQSNDNIVLMGHGFGGLLANYFNYLNDQKFKATILINPITSVGYINPYVSSIPSYKSNQKSIYIQLSKQFYYLTDIYGDFLDERFFSYVEKIKKYWPYFDTLRGFLSDYINLKNVHKIESRLPSNTFVILGDDNQIINVESTYKWIRNNNTSVMITTMTNASHYLYVDQPSMFNDILKSFLSKIEKDIHK